MNEAAEILEALLSDLRGHVGDRALDVEMTKVGRAVFGAIREDVEDAHSRFERWKLLSGWVRE